jgi:uncharacterized YigZ family protein
MDDRVFTYKTIGRPGLGEYKEKGSKFVGYTFRVQTEEEVATFIDELKREHLKARHHCYAYILDRNEQFFRANDDGEPSGTAGKPILGQIKSAGLKETLVVVVRYFGGTKLGASGLITAYKAAAEDAIAQSEIIQVSLQNTYRLSIDYPEMGKVLDILKGMDIEIKNKAFHECAEIEIALDCEESADMLKQFKANVLNVSVETIDDESEITYCAIHELVIYD